MYDLPEVGIDELDVLADWLELCALGDPSRTFSKTWVADVARDAGLLGNGPEGGFPGDDAYQEPYDLSEEDSVASFTDELWRNLAARSAVVGQSSYCYDLTGDMFSLRSAAWQNVPIHTLMLLCDVGRRYSLQWDSDETGELFEVAVAAAAGRLFGGHSVRFGWKIEPGWPTPIEDRVRLLSEELGLQTEDLTAKLDPNDKDRGLDVAARLSFGDNDPGSITFLIQCATGKYWRDKRGEPSITAWSDLLQWNSTLVRAIAVPWRLEEPYDYLRTFRDFGGAIVLDRLRLLAAGAEHLVAAGRRRQILRWCESGLSEIPTLST